MGTNQRHRIASKRGDRSLSAERERNCLRRPRLPQEGGYSFVEMITGDWLEGLTRLSAGSHVTTTVMKIDRRASRAMNVPVSRGPIRRAFLWSLAGNENESLRVRALASRYDASFPLAGFRRAHRMLQHVCAAER